MKLKKFTVNHGGKFNPEAPIVIDFSKSKMISVSGDQETGKTTLTELFLMACGHLGGDAAVEALVNKDTDKLDVELQFVGNDKADYEVSRTKSRLQVKREGEVKGAPKDLLKKMLGQVGVSPIEIKNAPVEDIVKWLSGYSSRPPEEFVRDMNKFKDGIKKAVKTRAEANKEAKAIRVGFVNEGIMDEEGQLIEKEWTAREKKFAEAIDISELSRKLTAVGTKSDKFIESEGKVNAQKERKKQIAEQIAALKKEEEQVDANITAGEEWLVKYATAKKDYDIIKKQYDTAAQDSLEFNKWQNIKTKKSELDEYETISQKADAQEKKLLKEKQELQWEVIPDIKGVEILLDDQEDEEGNVRKAGFYYNGLTSRQLSFSEWFGLVVQIMKKNKIKILVIDDAATLGSKFMETLEKLTKDGCYILYTEMSRGQQTIEIEYQ